MNLPYASTNCEKTTSLETIAEKIPEMIEKLLKQIKLVEFDRCHFKEFADSSLNFELVYFVNSNDYVYYMDANQKINLEIYKLFNKEKIEFAYPTQTVFVSKG